MYLYIHLYIYLYVCRFTSDQALSMGRTNYKNTMVGCKRLVGRPFQGEEVQQELALHCTKMEETPFGGVGYSVMYAGEQVLVPSEQVLTTVLSHLKQVAVNANGGAPVADAVVSVPGWFSQSQREAVLQACELSDIHCIRLMNEHTAVALGYGIFKSARNEFSATEPSLVMFVDMGQSQFSAAVASFIQGKLSILSSAYDPNLGGRDFDTAIAGWLADRFHEKTNLDARANPKAWIKLMEAAEKAKKTLSPVGVTEARVNVECLLDDRDLSVSITRDVFEELSQPLVERVAPVIQQALAEAGIDPEHLTDVEIVGGATRVKGVKRAISDAVGRSGLPPNFGLSTTLNADEAVSRGCALQCAILSPRFKVKPFEIHDVVNHPVSVIWQSLPDPDAGHDEGEEQRVCLFSRNSELPKTRRIVFKRNAPFSVLAEIDNQYTSDPAEAVMEVIVQVPEHVLEWSEVPKVRVNLKMDGNNVLSFVSAQLMEELPEDEQQEGGEEGGQEAEHGEDAGKKKFRKVVLDATVRPLMGMNQQQMEEIRVREVSMLEQDLAIQASADARNDLESFIYKTRDQMYGDLATFCDMETSQAISTSLEQAEEWLYSDEGYDPSVTPRDAFVSRLEAIQSQVAPLHRRMWESQNRQEAFANLVASCDKFERWCNQDSQSERYEHIPADKVNEVRVETEHARSWSYDMLTAQGNLGIDQDPVVTVGQIYDRIKALENKCNKVLKTPKPKPKPTETTTEADTSKDQEEESQKEAEENNGDEGKMDSEAAEEDGQSKEGTQEEGSFLEGDEDPDAEAEEGKSMDQEADEEEGVEMDLEG